MTRLSVAYHCLATGFLGYDVHNNIMYGATAEAASYEVMLMIDIDDVDHPRVHRSHPLLANNAVSRSVANGSVGWWSMYLLNS